MYRIKFHELQLRGVGGNAIVEIIIDQNKDDMMRDIKQNRFRFISKYDTEIPIPARGVIIIQINMGKSIGYVCMTSFTYCIPHVISSQPFDFEIIEKGVIPVPQFREVEESEFKEYNNLKDKQWITLNCINDPIVIQIKLEKIKPFYLFQSVSRGEYWIYKVTKIVLNTTNIFKKLSKNCKLEYDRDNMDNFNKRCGEQREKTIKLIENMSNNPPHFSLGGC